MSISLMIQEHIRLILLGEKNLHFLMKKLLNIQIIIIVMDSEYIDKQNKKLIRTYRKIEMFNLVCPYELVYKKKDYIFS